MKVLILGGTRFIGSYVTNQLVEQGHDVYLFHRGQTNLNIPGEVHHIYGDRKDIERYRLQFEKIQPDVVLDMFPFTEKDAQHVVNVFSHITNRLVAISSADVYLAFGNLIGLENEELEKTPITEDSPLRKTLYPYRAQANEGEMMYHYDKILVENVYRENPFIPTTILRLPMVHGPLDRQYRPFPYLKRMIDGRPHIVLDKEVAKWVTCRGYVENVAHSIVLAITNEQAANQTYNVSDNVYMTEEEWVKEIQKAYEKWDGAIIVDESGSIAPTGMNPKQPIYMSSEKIRKEIGFKEIISFQEGLKRTIEWILNNPPELHYEKEYVIEDEIIENRKRSGDIL